MDSQRQDRLEERYLNIHEAAEILEIGEEELWELVRQQKVTSHNIAGAFLRFRKEDVEVLKNKWRIERELFPIRESFFSHHNTVTTAGILDKLKDFWYFNDFYILCSVLVIVLLYFIVSSQ